MKNTFLMHKKGYKGILKKGMTVRVNFITTRRSAWELLVGRADNWLNLAGVNF
jgi:hypothetical protein